MCHSATLVLAAFASGVPALYEQRVALVIGNDRYPNPSAAAAHANRSAQGSSRAPAKRLGSCLITRATEWLRFP
jgi:hypothetical protein